MDDQHMKDTQVDEAEKVAGKAHESAAAAHEKSATEEYEKSNPQ